MGSQLVPVRPRIVESVNRTQCCGFFAMHLVADRVARRGVAHPLRKVLPTRHYDGAENSPCTSTRNGPAAIQSFETIHYASEVFGYSEIFSLIELDERVSTLHLRSHVFRVPGLAGQDRQCETVCE